MEKACEGVRTMEKACEGLHRKSTREHERARERAKGAKGEKEGGEGIEKASVAMRALL